MVFRVGSKRSRIEIYVDVLQAVRMGENRPIKIMYHTNLSWKPLMQVLDALTEQNLISLERKSIPAVYKITEKSLNVLNYFKKAIELVEVKPLKS